MFNQRWMRSNAVGRNLTRERSGTMTELLSFAPYYQARVLVRAGNSSARNVYVRLLLWARFHHHHVCVSLV